MSQGSWELRWFSAGEVPQEVNSWFKDLDESSYIIYENPREDHQMWASKACENMGIKIREEKLEIKWRKQVEPYSLPAGNASGIAENWLKWNWTSGESYPGAYLSFLVEYPQGPTVKINKKRILRRYRALHQSNNNIQNDDDNDDYKLSPLTSRIIDGMGIQVEITNLEIRNKHWWSIAFETFGAEDANLLHMTANRFLSKYGGPHLTEDNSYGYPHWISLVLDL